MIDLFQFKQSNHITNLEILHKRNDELHLSIERIQDNVNQILKILIRLKLSKAYCL